MTRSGLGKVMGVFGKELDDQTQMFKGLAQSGATFGSSIVTMGNAAYESGLPLVAFQELIQNNTGTLAKLFGSVNAGIPQITGLSRALKNSPWMSCQASVSQWKRPQKC